MDGDSSDRLLSYRNTQDVLKSHIIDTPLITHLLILIKHLIVLKQNQ